MEPRSLAETIAQIRVYSDTEGTLTRPTNAQIEAMINASVRSFYARLSDTGSDWTTQRTTLTTASGVETVDIDNAWKIRGVAWKKDARTWYPLSRFAERDRALYEGRPWSHLTRYRVGLGQDGVQQIVLCPVPDGAYELAIAYTKSPPVFSSGDDLLCWPGMWEWIVLDVTIKILAAEETDVSVWAAMRDDEWRSAISVGSTVIDENRSEAISDYDQG